MKKLVIGIMSIILSLSISYADRVIWVGNKAVIIKKHPKKEIKGCFIDKNNSNQSECTEQPKIKVDDSIKLEFAIGAGSNSDIQGCYEDKPCE